MQQSVLEMAKDIVKAQIQAGQLTPDTMNQALQDTFDNLTALQTRGERVETGKMPVAGRPPGTVDWRQSITQHAITCLECGAVYKQLSKRHLKEHDLTTRLYRAKYNIPRTLSLAGRSTTARRRKAVQATRPWEKTPRYLEAQSEMATADKKANAKKARS